MKKIIIIVFILMISSVDNHTVSQSRSVFVLVDLSMNIKNDPNNRIDHQMREDAINFVSSLITAKYKPGDFPNWSPTGVAPNQIIANILAGKGSPLISTDDYLMIMPFGKLATSNQFNINLLQNYPSDFDKFYRFPFNYNDWDTWGSIAEARACNIAFNHKIPHYYLIRIQGKPDDPNSELISNEDQEMLDLYETGSKAESLAKFSHKNVRFSVTIKEMNISKIPGMKKFVPISVGTQNVTKKSLKLIAPKGDEKNPFKTDSEIVHASWMCIGCGSDSIVTYSLKVNNLDTKKTKTHKVKNANSKALKLMPGKYKISIATNDARSKAQYITIGNSSGGGFLWLFLLVILGVGGYFAYRYYSNEKRPTTNSDDDEWENKSQSQKSKSEDSDNIGEDWT